MTSRKRSGSGSSKRPKEKVVYIYELFFHGEDPTTESTEFWNEFFLLQPNVESLEAEITKLTCEQFMIVNKNLTLLFQSCIEMMETGRLQYNFFKICVLNEKYMPYFYLSFRSSEATV